MNNNKTPAIVYCEGHFGTLNGKTAHGLVRFTNRYDVRAVIDSTLAGRDAGDLLSGKPNGIPVVSGLQEALQLPGPKVAQFVVGLAPDGGALGHKEKADIKEALRTGLDVDSGLHDFLTDDESIVELAGTLGRRIRDVRKPPPKEQLHFFTGKILDVTSTRIAVLGCDSAVGKRTTSWLLVQGLREAGYSTEMIGTGQTAWMQGARYSIMLDTIINDFLTGEIEHVVWSAWKESSSDALVVEGQASLFTPAYPGGYEILAGSRPQAVVFQHVPARKAHDGFPAFPIPPLDRQIKAIETVADTRVVAITVNHENLPSDRIDEICAEIEKETGLPACDPLVHGVSKVVTAVRPFIAGKKRG